MILRKLVSNSQHSISFIHFFLGKRENAYKAQTTAKTGIKSEIDTQDEGIYIERPS